MGRLNICLISEEFPPETGWGGIGTYAYNLALGLAAQGHGVHVIARGWGKYHVQTVGDVRVHRVSIPEPSWRRGTHFLNLHFPETRQILFWSLRANQAISRISAAEGLDVIESSEYHAQGLIAALRQRRVPMVVKLHSPAYLLSRVNGTLVGGSQWDARISERLEYSLAQQARMVTSPSRQLAEEVARTWSLDRKSVRVIPNPIDDELFQTRDDAVPETLDVVYVGRVERRKGVETLIEALPAILNDFPRARVRLVGKDHPSGPGGMSMSDHLRQRLKDLRVPETAVEFHGPVDRAALPGVYGAAAVCVIPSLWENFPYTCLEAMASGCAVVASASGGIPEIISDEVDGLLVPSHCPSALATTVTRLLSDPPLRRLLGARARATVRDRFSRRVICADTIHAYKSLL
jgi:glycogen synthase